MVFKLKYSAVCSRYCFTIAWNVGGKFLLNHSLIKYFAYHSSAPRARTVAAFHMAKSSVCRAGIYGICINFEVKYCERIRCYFLLEITMVNDDVFYISYAALGTQIDTLLLNWKYAEGISIPKSKINKSKMCSINYGTHYASHSMAVAIETKRFHSLSSGSITKRRNTENFDMYEDETKISRQMIE